MNSSYTRGAAIDFVVVFRDADGLAVQASSAAISLNFPKASDGMRDTATLTLVYDGATQRFKATWDSSVARQGLVNWSAKGRGAGNQAIVQDGTFTLTANTANIA